MKLSLAQLLSRAIEIAAVAHRNQVDKANAPYILHPLRLMMQGQTLLEQMVAVLHDVVEDSDWTLEQLAAEGFPPAVLTALDCLTRRRDESYDTFIQRVLTDPIAMQVKRYDLEDNMNLMRMAVLTDRDLQRLQRYHQAHQCILQVIQAHQNSEI